MPALLLALYATVVLLGCTRPSKKKDVPLTQQAFLHAVQAERSSAGKNAQVRLSDYWYKNSFIYALDIEVFQDSDGDGTGDIGGLISRLDYIRSLGADAIWLAPFQPTPNQDDGYDVSDFYGIDPRLGTAAEFDRLVSEARKCGLRILMDLVVNHTSEQHPWFVQATDTGSSYHRWYIWSAEKPRNINTGMVFPGIQHSTWSWESRAGAYYYHRFYAFQPDLNVQYPPVWAEIKRIEQYWLDKGVDGFRLDAVPFLIEVPQTKGERFEHEFERLAEMRQLMEAARPGGVILGEANVLPSESKDFFGNHGEAMNMMFNFYVNQYLFHALASGRVEGLQEALEKTKEIPAQAQWAQFLRNHDEVDLGRLSDQQREAVYKAFGPERRMQLYDRGIRRRLATMLNNDRRRMELAYSLLLALPSTPVIRYGEEIGMGDNLSLKERESVRTPMQWSDSVQAGFSKAATTVRPLIDTGMYGFRRLNVQAQRSDSASFWHWLVKMVNLRKSLPAIGWGRWEAMAVLPEVLVLQYEWEGETIVTVHNFGAQARTVALLPQEAVVLEDLLPGKAARLQPKAREAVHLDGYGYRWFRKVPR